MYGNRVENGVFLGMVEGWGLNDRPGGAAGAQESNEGKIASSIKCPMGTAFIPGKLGVLHGIKLRTGKMPTIKAYENSSGG